MVYWKRKGVLIDTSAPKRANVSRSRGSDGESKEKMALRNGRGGSGGLHRAVPRGRCKVMREPKTSQRYRGVDGMEEKSKETNGISLELGE